MNAETTVTGSVAALENKPNQSMKAGYICLAVASFFILVMGLFGWIIAGPLSLAALVLGIVGLTKGNTTKGVILVIASVVVPTTIQFVQLALVAARMAAVMAP